jgi:hypothetical protein
MVQNCPSRVAALGPNNARGVYMCNRPCSSSICRREHGPIPALAVVFQARYTLLPILPAPSHQTGLATARTLSHLLGWVVGAVQSYRQQTGSRRTILARIMCMRQFLDLVFSQLKSSFSHDYIIPSLNGFVYKMVAELMSGRARPSATPAVGETCHDSVRRMSRATWETRIQLL